MDQRSDLQKPTSLFPRRLFDKIRKIAPRVKPAAASEGAAGHIERLALAAPHLLSDLGFERDPRAGNAERAVWRNGAFVVTISRAPGTPAPRVAVRTEP